MQLQILLHMQKMLLEIHKERQQHLTSASQDLQPSAEPLIVFNDDEPTPRSAKPETLVASANPKSGIVYTELNFEYEIPTSELEESKAESDVSSEQRMKQVLGELKCLVGRMCTIACIMQDIC